MVPLSSLNVSLPVSLGVAIMFTLLRQQQAVSAELLLKSTKAQK
jgi:hypothetical protein